MDLNLAVWYGIPPPPNAYMHIIYEHGSGRNFGCMALIWPKSPNSIPGQIFRQLQYIISLP